MKRVTHIVLLILATALALVGASINIASAATLRWLVDGQANIMKLASEATGEVELENTNAGGLGVNAALLCSVTFDESIDIEAEGAIEKVLDLSGNEITLANPLACTNDKECTSPFVAFVNLPWLKELELMGTEASPLFLDVIRSGGKGEPGWEMDCTTIFGLIEETCTASFGADLENDATENDVLRRWILSDSIFKCTGSGGETGFMNSEESPWLVSVPGHVVAISYE